jgi:hypothetical protein
MIEAAEFTTSGSASAVDRLIVDKYIECIFDIAGIAGEPEANDEGKRLALHAIYRLSMQAIEVIDGRVG